MTKYTYSITRWNKCLCDAKFNYYFFNIKCHVPWLQGRTICSLLCSTYTESSATCHFWVHLTDAITLYHHYASLAGRGRVWGLQTSFNVAVRFFDGIRTSKQPTYTCTCISGIEWIIITVSDGDDWLRSGADLLSWVILSLLSAFLEHISRILSKPYTTL